MATKFADIRDLPSGARFYLGDLHVHSFEGSHDVKDAAATPEALVDQAVNDGISVLAITDHNSIRNSQRSVDYGRSKYPGALLVLGGIEVTTAHGHLLVYFSPDRIEDLVKFFGRINITQTSESDSHTTMSMADVATEALRLGGICIAAHIDQKAGFEGSHAGYPNWKKDIVTHPGILGVELLDPAKLCWYSEEDEGTPEGAERKRLLAQRAQAPGAAARATFAHIQNSDAHSLASFATAHAKRTMTRIKMDQLSFEGFRTALADPAARVRADVDVPSAVPVVVGLHVQGGFLDMQKFRLSENLTCFIGGRGTGKSTAIKCLAYGLGLETDLAQFDNCPDSVVVYCRDGQGVTYRYERMRGSGAPRVQAYDKANGQVIDATADAFRVEFYGQGDLQRVAADPLSRPDLLQQFLDRHTPLSDLETREEELVLLLGENGSGLRPLEIAEAGRAAKMEIVKDCDTKLKVAEEGQLKEIASTQSALGAEKALCQTVETFAKDYRAGLSLRVLQRDFDGAVRLAGQLTERPESLAAIADLRSAVESANAVLREHEVQINQSLQRTAGLLTEALAVLAAIHRDLDSTLDSKVAQLQKAGLSGSVAELQRIIETRGRAVRDIARLDERTSDLTRLRSERRAYQDELSVVREEKARRRKAYIKRINQHLARSIDDYTVVVVYDESGLVESFHSFLRSTMQGSYLPDESSRRLALAITPSRLADLIQSNDLTELAATGGLGVDWARRLIDRCGRLEVLHSLQTIDKPPSPSIRVLTRAAPSREIPVNQLSDGQRHTILLTIAMLAESEMPLVIDQPEDDLDNAFVFSSIVRMLRHVKERRQIIVVTHNANIAVLGDAEQIFPMQRIVDRGSALDVGSIDGERTKAAVQSILEGGQLAFLRRKEIYGH